MNFSLIPRFNYSFPFYRYMINLWVLPKDHCYIFDHIPFDNVYFHNHARTGIRLLLSSTGKRNLNIGVQVYTCHTIFQAIKQSGNNIVFLDINDRFGIDLNDLRKKIDHIDVIIITHTFGIPDDFEAIKKISGDRIIIEDCAHSYLSQYKGKYTGTLGDAAVFSIGLGKFPPVGQGGLTRINTLDRFPAFQTEFEKLSEESFASRFFHIMKISLFSLLLARPLYGLFTYRIGKKIDKKFDFINKYEFKESKGFAFDKKFFLRNIPLFKKIIEKKKSTWDLFSKSTVTELNYPVSKGDTGNNYIAPICFPDRNQLFEYLLERNVETGKHFHHSIRWAMEFGYHRDDCPKAERLTQTILTLPLHDYLNPKIINKMAQHLNKYMNQYIHNK